MNVSRQTNGHCEGERSPAEAVGPLCMAPHVVNGSLATPSPRAPTSAGDVHEEFFGDDPLPDHEWEERSHYCPEIPQDMSAEELRNVMATFGHVEDVQLITGAGGQLAAHVVFRLPDEAECARSALGGQESLATLRELTPLRRGSECELKDDPEGGETPEVAAEPPPPEQQQQQQQQAVQQQQQQPAARNFHRYHVPPGGYARPMLPLSYMCPPGPGAGPWGGTSLYYPMSAALHPLYAGVQGPANYLAAAMAPPPPQAVTAAHRKSHRGGDDSDGPCVRLVVHTRLVGAIIGVGGATIRKITRHQVRVDVDNNIMKRPWPPSNGRPEAPGTGRPSEENGPGASRSLQSQVVFIYGSVEAVERAVLDIMKLIAHEAQSKKLDHDPDLALLVENTLCGRIIGKGGHKIKKIREMSDVDIVLCNETIVRYDDAYHVYLAQHQLEFPSLRIISIRGELERSMDAFRQLVTSINEIRRRSPLDTASAVFANQMPPFAGLIQPRPIFPASNLALRPANYPPYMPLAPTCRFPGAPMRRPVASGDQEADTAGETAPPGLHLDFESLYVLVPHSTGGAIIGTEGRNIHKMMEVTGASVSVSKHQPSDHAESAEEAAEGEPKRLVTIRAASEQSLDLALLFIFRKVQSCRRDVIGARANKTAAGRQAALIHTVMRVPKALMGRLCGRHHHTVASIERHSGAHIEMSQPWFADLLPSNKPEDNDGVEFDTIFVKGEHQATQAALTQLRQRLLEAFFAYNQHTGLTHPFYPGSGPSAAVAAALAAMQHPMMPLGAAPPGAGALFHPMAPFAAGGPALAPGPNLGGPGGLSEGVQLYRLAAPPNFTRPAAHPRSAAPEASPARRSGRTEPAPGEEETPDEAVAGSGTEDASGGGEEALTPPAES